MAFPADVRPGDPMTAAFINAVKNAILRDFTTDGNISLVRTGQNIAIGLAAKIPGVYTPVLAKITAVHKNYVVAKRWQQARNAGSGRYEWTLGTTEFNVAKHPELQPQFFDGKTVADPVLGGDWEFAYDGTQTRTASGDDGDQDHRIQPWMSTDTTNAAPMICIPMGIWVPNDANDADVHCPYIEVGPRAWTVYTPES